MALIQNFDRAVWKTGDVNAALTGPVGMNLIVIGFQISNVGETGTTVDVTLGTHHLVKNAAIAYGGALKPIDKDKLILLPGDTINISSTDSASNLEVVISYMKVSI